MLTGTSNPAQEGTESAGQTENNKELLSAQVEIPDEKDARFCVLSYEQVRRLNDLMSEVINIHGRGNFPTIDVRLSDLVSVVKSKLDADGVKVHEIRLNGSGASSVLVSSDISYNDLDLIFSVDLSTAKAFERVKAAVLESLMELLPEGVSRKRMSSCSLKEAYVSKMVKVNDSGDRWSLISLGNNRAKTVELKFVHTMRRQYEFSVDSFHVILDTLFLYYECNKADATPISDNFYPTVVAESMFGDFEEALYHLHKKLIATKNPEEIRGGGLLKYCNLLCRGYRPASHNEVKSMERYMCSRFFIDFPDINQQQGKLENYLYNHFQSSEDQTKYHYLMILYQVVDESTLCLMPHELRLTLTLIEDMAFQVYTPPMSYYGSEGVASPNISDLSLLSPASSNSSCSASSASNLSSASSSCSSSSSNSGSNQSCCSAGTCSSMSTSSSCSSASNSGTATPVMPNSHHQACNPLQNMTHAPPPPASIPTYEIVTSCQPAVVYSNGYYYTSFMHPPTSENSTPVPVSCTQVHPATVNVVAVSPGQCLACSCNQWVASNQPQPQQS